MSATVETLERRAEVLGAIRAFFRARGFLEVETPAIVPCPGLDVHLRPFEVGGAGWLATSPEFQMKRLLARGATKVFQIAKAFRREEVGAHHEREFTMLEWYRGPGAMRDVIADTEALVNHVAQVAGGPDGRLHAGGPIDSDGAAAVGALNTALPWRRLTVRDAFAAWAPEVDIDDPTTDDAFFEALVERIEPALETRPTFLTHWPARMASLARLDPDDARVAERFEAYVGGLELCNGFGELTDPVEQRARFEADLAARRQAGLETPPLDERFLKELGLCPPAAGNALGVDRLVMLALGKTHIAEVLAFPQSDL